MNQLSRTLITLVAVAAVAGCSGSTAESRQPTKAEIQQGVDKRLAEVDQIQGLSPEQKERMKAQIRGTGAPTR